jgi:hypothetical protein
LVPSPEGGLPTPASGHTVTTRSRRWTALRAELDAGRRMLADLQARQAEVHSVGLWAGWVATLSDVSDVFDMFRSRADNGDPLCLWSQM